MADARLSVLIPAAGASQRLGQAKQLLQYRGQSLLGHVIEVTSALDPLETIVVTGANAEAVRRALGPAHVRWVHNADWSAGMGTSIALGAGAVASEADGVLIILCDQYRIEAGDLQALASRWRAAPERITAASAAGRCMPPVIFPASLLRELKSLTGDRGAQSLFRQHATRLAPVEMAHATFDVDTRGQWLVMQSTRG